MRTAREPSTTTPMTSAMSSPRRFLICEPILSNSSRQECAHWSATEDSSSLGTTCEAMLRCGARCLMKHGQEEVPETVAMLAEPEEQDMDDLQSNVFTEPIEDVAQEHIRDLEVEWLELLVEAPVETPAAASTTSCEFTATQSCRNSGLQKR